MHQSDPGTYVRFFVHVLPLLKDLHLTWAIWFNLSLRLVHLLFDLICVKFEANIVSADLPVVHDIQINEARINAFKIFCTTSSFLMQSASVITT